MEADGQPSARTGTAPVAIAESAAAILIMIGIAGPTILARQSGRHIKLANIGMVFAAFGFALLFLGTVIQAVFFSGNFPGMPYLVLPGVLAVIVGFVLIGIFILRSGILPRWLGIFLLISSLALLAANGQAVTVLLAIPFGLAIATAGNFMWSGRTEVTAEPARGLIYGVSSVEPSPTARLPSSASAYGSTGGL